MKKISLSDLQQVAPDTAAAPQPDPELTAEKLASAARAMQSAANVPAISRVVLEGLVRFAEFLLITAVGFAVHFVYLAHSEGYGPQYLIAMPLIGALSVLAIQSSELYKISAFRKFPADGLQLAGAVTIVYGSALVFIFFLKLDTIYSRVFMLAWYLGSLVALTGERALLALLVDRLISSGTLPGAPFSSAAAARQTFCSTNWPRNRYPIFKSSAFSTTGQTNAPRPSSPVFQNSGRWTI